MNTQMRGEIAARPHASRRSYRILICAASDIDAFEIHLAIAGMAAQTRYVTLVASLAEMRMAMAQMDYDLVICADSVADTGGSLLEKTIPLLADNRGHSCDMTVCHPPPPIHRLADGLAGQANIEVNACQNTRCRFNRTAQAVFNEAGGMEATPFVGVRPAKCPLRHEVEIGHSRRRPSD